jgi:3'(2'), 5'-bisphosphate nucleotidase
VSVGSSLKFCLLARGDAQLYPRFTPTCEWDTAAGQAVLEAAGGAVVTLDGESMRYGKGELGFLNPYFVAAASLELAQQTAEEMRNLLS